jgi:hypothetical protein
MVAALSGTGCLATPAMSTSVSPPLSVSQYRAQASTICKTEERVLNTREPHTRTLVQGVEFAFTTNKVAYRALARLRPPAQFVRLNAEMLGDFRVLLSVWPAAVAAAKRGEVAYERASIAGAKGKAAARVKTAGADLTAVWKKLGVPVCNH